MFSISVYVVDEVLLTHTTIQPRDLNGNVIVPTALVEQGQQAGFEGIMNATLNPSQGGTVFDRISQFALTTYSVTWSMLELLSGTFAFNLLFDIGVHPAFVFALKLMFPLFVGFQVMWFLVGRY